MLMIVIVLIIAVAITDTKAGFKERDRRQKRDLLEHRKTNAELEEKLYQEHFEKCNDKQQAYDEAIAEIKHRGFEPCCPFWYLSADSYTGYSGSHFEPIGIRWLRDSYRSTFHAGDGYNDQHNEEELYHILYDNWPKTDGEWDDRNKRDGMIMSLRCVGTWMKLTYLPDDIYQIVDITFFGKYFHAFYTIKEITNGTIRKISVKSNSIVWVTGH